MRKTRRNFGQSKPDKGVFYNPDSTANKLAEQFVFTAKLKSSSKAVMIVFKNMELVIMESDGKTNKTVEKHKYNLGDVGIWKYCSAIKRYISKGYVLEGSISNINEVWKNDRKKQRATENDKNDNIAIPKDEDDM